jgi:hypothetical protein
MSDRGARALELAVDALKRIEAAAPVGSVEADRKEGDRTWRDQARHQQRIARLALVEIAQLGRDADSGSGGGDAA